MIEPGEIYMADIPPGQQHQVVIVSREQLNRGKYVIAALITSQKFVIRSTLANWVPLKAGTTGTMAALRAGIYWSWGASCPSWRGFRRCALR